MDDILNLYQLNQVLSFKDEIPQENSDIFISTLCACNKPHQPKLNEINEPINGPINRPNTYMDTDIDANTLVISNQAKEELDEVVLSIIQTENELEQLKIEKKKLDQKIGTLKLELSQKMIKYRIDSIEKNGKHYKISNLIRTKRAI